MPIAKRVSELERGDIIVDFEGALLAMVWGVSGGVNEAEVTLMSGHVWAVHPYTEVLVDPF